jgi:hypothetical protein
MLEIVQTLCRSTCRHPGRPYSTRGGVCELPRGCQRLVNRTSAEALLDARSCAGRGGRAGRRRRQAEGAASSRSAAGVSGTPRAFQTSSARVKASCTTSSASARSAPTRGETADRPSSCLAIARRHVAVGIAIRFDQRELRRPVTGACRRQYSSISPCWVSAATIEPLPKMIMSLPGWRLSSSTHAGSSARTSCEPCHVTRVRLRENTIFAARLIRRRADVRAAAGARLPRAAASRPATPACCSERPRACPSQRGATRRSRGTGR